MEESLVVNANPLQIEMKLKKEIQLDVKPISPKNTMWEQALYSVREKVIERNSGKLPDQVEMAEAVVDIARDGSGLNAYHIAAFFPTWLNFVRASFTASIQFGLVPLILFYEMNHQDKEMCEESGSDTGKVAGILMMILTHNLVKTFDRNLSVSWDVSFCMGAPLPNTGSSLSLAWIPLGVLLNLWALMGASLGGFILVYTSDTPFDMVLNALALEFLTDVDDSLVSDFDYKATDVLFTPFAEGKRVEETKISESWGPCVRNLTMFIVSSMLLVTAIAPIYVGVCY